MSLYQHFCPNGPSGFGYGSTAEVVTAGISLAGKTFLVTGCNSGLGFETMRVLALRGGRVLATARTAEQARGAAGAVRGDVVPLACELSDPGSIRACVAAVSESGGLLDAIICNAGVMALRKLELVHGYEKQFFTNHIGHFVLVTGLIERLALAGRVVMVSSTAHRRAPAGGIAFDNLDGSAGYAPWREYGQSKIANILFAKELARRFASSRRTANAVHPGVIVTKLVRHSALARVLETAIAPVFLKNVEQGAATQVYAATNAGIADVSGEYMMDSNVARPRPDAENHETAERLWDVSERIAKHL